MSNEVYHCLQTTEPVVVVAAAVKEEFHHIHSRKTKCALLQRLLCHSLQSLFDRTIMVYPQMLLMPREPLNIP